MPYILLVLGLLIGIYGLYRFMANASVIQIKTLFLSAFIVGAGIAVFFLAISGRLPAAIALMAVLSPLVAAMVKVRRDGRAAPAGPNEVPRPPMGRKEALEILGLSEGATPEEIDAAYKKLIKKVHPDQEGSAWLAAKLNQARDELLK